MTDSQPLYPVKSSSTNYSSSEDTASTPLPATLAQKHQRSQSIEDQLHRTPKVNPTQWGHSLSKSYGGSDWPLPTPGNINSPPFSGSSPENGQAMDFKALVPDQWTIQSTPKKRGPKPKNEPAATVSHLLI
jgi:hypothetical protein